MNLPLCFQWDVSALSGWGVYGLNLLRCWESAAGAPVFCGAGHDVASLSTLDVLRRQALAAQLSASEQLKTHYSVTGGSHFNGAVLYGLGNRFSDTVGDTLPLNGRGNFGVTFFENTNFTRVVEGCSRFVRVVTGSTWCEDVLRARGAANISTVIQGVDLSLFHPAPRAGSLRGKFAVFSGGKLEFRKGQDLVMLAFKAFAARHPEAVLVTAWHSPWPALARTVEGNPAIAPMAYTPGGAIDTLGWAAANGVNPEQIFDIGVVPNHFMPAILREMDVGLFPNRCEGGTNLVAMETMACGVPVIVSANTGHKDLTATGTTYALTRQRPIPEFSGMGTEGWGESDVEEIVAHLESIYSDRRKAASYGLAGAAVMKEWSWENQIGRLHKIIAAHCP